MNLIKAHRSGRGIILNIDAGSLSFLRTKQNSLFENTSYRVNDEEKVEKVDKGDKSQNSTDTVIISDEGSQLSSQQIKNQEDKLEQAASQGAIEDLREQMQQIQEQSKSQAEEYKILLKCMKIALNVASGNKVPEQDQQYLRENNPELFAQSLEMRIPNENPEECDSVTKEDESSDDESKGGQVTLGQVDISISVS